MQLVEVENKLRASGVKPTKQRLEIGMLLFAEARHMSADRIIADLKSEGSRVSKATVYNTLKLFSKNGLIKELNVDPSRRYYDSTTHAHHHFYNIETGELTDIAEDRVSIIGLPKLPQGTERESVEILIKIKSA